MKTRNNKNKIFRDGQTPEMDQVIDHLKSLDTKNRRLMFRMFIFYLIIALVYIGLMIFDPGPDLVSENRIIYLSYILIFIVSALFFRYHYRKTYRVDYTAPVLKMLEAARDRHRFMKPGKVWFVLFLVIACDVIVTWVMLDSSWFIGWSLLLKIVVIQLSYFAIMALSLLVGFLIWRRKSRPLVRNLTRIIEELRRDETGSLGS